MIRRWLSGIVAAIVAAMGAVLYFKGRKDANDANEIQEHNEYIATRKRMDKPDGPSDDDVAKWLHERAKRRGNL